MAKRYGKIGFHSTGRFYIRIRGKMVYFPREITTIEQAEAFLPKILARYGVTEEGKTPDDTPIDVLLSVYLERIRETVDMSDDVYDQKERLLGLFAARVKGQTPSSISALSVSEFIHSFKKHTTGGGVVQTFSQLRAAWRWIMNNLAVRTDILAGIKRPRKRARGEEVIVSPEEWERIRLILPSAYRDIADFIFYTGCRPSEAFGATVQEWDDSEQLLTKVKSKNKGKGKPRFIRPPEQAVAIIRRCIDGRKSGPIFRHKWDKPLSQGELGKQMAAAGRKIGRPAKTTMLYSLRHSFVWRNLRKGTPLSVISQWLGTSVATLEQHYAHLLSKKAILECKYAMA